jgi:hypothetical protein
MEDKIVEEDVVVVVLDVEVAVFVNSELAALMNERVATITTKTLICLF